ncbi:hypothetical protein L1049_022422 [Liquidambar formosana]|uniref:Replication factor C subunit 3 n=1 Tax=Liquidambar formosana TaxID=63359 RepID=A0AAP0RCI3_LIQFO
MPKLDPDPFSPWSSSSEPNISESDHPQPIFSSMCWWTGRASKTRKSSSKHSDLTEESLNEFNRRNDPEYHRWTSDPYIKGLTAESSLYITRLRLSGWKARSSCFEDKRSSEAAALATMEPSSCPSATARPSSLLVDMEEMHGEKNQEFNWASKYQPKALKDFICHQEKAEMLCSLVSNGDLSHYIFEGPPGVGKRTMVMAFLRECFGPVKLEYAIMELMKKTYSSNLLNQNNMQINHTNHKAIVLYGAEKLSRNAQLYIRSLSDSYSSHNKVIFCCSDISKLQHLWSLCTVIELLPPSNMEIVEVLKFIAKKEDIQLPYQLAKTIALRSRHSLQQAIRSFEATSITGQCCSCNYPFNENEVIIMTGWEEELAKIAKDMIKEQSPKQLYNIKEKLIFLRKYNISPDFIFMTLVKELKRHLNDEFQSKIDALYLEYNADV